MVPNYVTCAPLLYNTPYIGVYKFSLCVLYIFFDLLKPNKFPIIEGVKILVQQKLPLREEFLC